MSLVVVLGGTRSGKSAVAERIAGELTAGTGEAVTYVATGIATDDDMADRIALHRARRPAGWSTVEAADGPALPGLLLERRGPVLLDSIGTWVAAHRDLAVDIDALVGSLRRRDGSTVVVAEEVGLSVHPSTPLGRRFVDVVGAVNQAVAAVADRAVLVVAGRTVEL